MTFDDVRKAVASKLNTYWVAAHGSVIMQYGNRNIVDMDQQQDPFVDCKVIFSNGSQANMGDSIIRRYYGAIYFSVYTREGEGVSEALVYLGDLEKQFSVKSFEGVNTKVAIPVPEKTAKGWCIEAIRVPFWFDVMP
jgi:hypothetical protein